MKPQSDTEGKLIKSSVNSMVFADQEAFPLN